MTVRQAVDVVAQTLGRLVMEAIHFRDQLLADGATKAQADAGLEAVIRERWPKPHDRTLAWRYICDLCDDTGLRMFQCTPASRCNGISTRTDSPFDKPGKYRRLCVGSASYEHDYGEPCICPKGDRFTTRTKSTQDDFTTATKSKPKPMSRFGR